MPTRFARPLFLLLSLLWVYGCDATATEPGPSGAEGGIVAEAPPSQETTLADLAIGASEADEPEFTVLVAALEAAGLAGILDGNRAYTVFAPTDAAFGRLLELRGLTLEELLADTGTLRQLLLHHVVPGRRSSRDVLESDQLRTEQGGFVFPVVVDGVGFIVDGTQATADAPIVTPDLEASNGVLHVIGEVLVPGPGSRPGGGHRGPTLADLVREAADAEEAEFTVLLAALEAAELLPALDARGQLTVFAPTDAAFERLLAVLGLSPEELLADTALLREVLLHHVARGRRDAADVLDSEQIRTLQGDFIFPVVVDGTAFIVDGTAETEDAQVVEADVEARNGIVHIIDEVLVPGPGSRPGGQDDDADDDDEDSDDDESDDGDEDSEDDESDDDDEDSDDDESDDDDEDREGPTVAGFVTGAASGDAPDFTVLLAALQSTGLLEELDRNRMVTVFAPTDAAFDDLLARLGLTAEELLADTALLRRVLEHHLVNGERFSDDLLDAGRIRTRAGDFVTPRVDDEGAFIVDRNDLTDDARLLGPEQIDIDVANGVIHVIDRVLLPAT